MSVFSAQASALAGPADGMGQPAGQGLDVNILMGDTQTSRPQYTSTSALDAYRDARAIVRLIQCRECSLPLRTPLALPCGNSLCRACLPELHKRENISYPNTPSREQGFVCPFAECGKNHAVGDCSLDVTLQKIIERVGIEIARIRPRNTDTPTLLDERPKWKNIVDSSKEQDHPHSRILNGGRLVATFTMAELGELRFDSEVSYQTMSPAGNTWSTLDNSMLETLKETTRNELDCQVCYALLLDPLTLTCGHTFCRKCVARVLDHSPLCPVCRRDLNMPPSLDSEPGNKRLMSLLMNLCPEHVAAREEAAAQEEPPMTGEQNVPLFVVTLAYPSMPTFLHVFEPRYRLMIRRAVESGNRKFGMIMYNHPPTPQGELGTTDFMQYGTLLHIVSLELLPDGRSLIETVGVSRFRVKSYGRLDGYYVADVERINDVSLVEEETMEAAEVGTSSPAGDAIAQLDNLSTRELLQIGLAFVYRMRNISVPWLRQQVINSYGPPPENPALFSYWLASILPIRDVEKYKLLSTTSVRQRLKICAGWVRVLEGQRW